MQHHAPPDTMLRRAGDRSVRLTVVAAWRHTGSAGSDRVSVAAGRRTPIRRAPLVRKQRGAGCIVLREHAVEPVLLLRRAFGEFAWFSYAEALRPLPLDAQRSVLNAARAA